MASFLRSEIVINLYSPEAGHLLPIMRTTSPQKTAYNEGPTTPTTEKADPRRIF
jgi:hypothetical protein